eukprot:evm.model.scf_3310.1 EVM.evm.TU.scf_3310.1   scf_3310:13123-13989(-)
MVFLLSQVLCCEDGGEADLQETADGAGAELMCSRRESWEEMCLQKAIHFSSRVGDIRHKVEALDAQLHSHERQRLEEDLLLEMFLSQEVNQRYKQERARSAALAANTAHGQHDPPVVPGTTVVPASGSPLQRPHSFQASNPSVIATTWPAAHLGPLPSGVHRQQGPTPAQQASAGSARQGVRPSLNSAREVEATAGVLEQTEPRRVAERSVLPLPQERRTTSATTSSIDPALTAAMASRSSPSVGPAGTVRHLEARQGAEQGGVVGSVVQLNSQTAGGHTNVGGMKRT